MYVYIYLYITYHILRYTIRTIASLKNENTMVVRNRPSELKYSKNIFTFLG